MIWQVRRVLTGHDSEGKSTIIADGQATNVKEMASMPGLALTDLWETTGAPATNDGHKDAEPPHARRLDDRTFRTQPSRTVAR